MKTTSTSTTFDGINFANAKRIVDYEFGDSIIKLEKDNVGLCYEVHVLNKKDKSSIERFVKYHKRTFKVIVYERKYELYKLED